MAASQELQEDATERAVKHLRMDKPYKFRRKGHEKQYRFNSGIADHVAATTIQLEKIQPTSDKDKATLDKARKELEEGASALAERQKHIRIADQSEHSWETVAAYIGNNVAANKDDARRIEKAEKTAEQRVSKRKQKAAATIASQWVKRPLPSSRPQPQGPPQLAPFLLPRPSYGHPSSARPVGPCWACGEVGHLKTSCPCLSKSYPFMSIDKSHKGGPSKVSDYSCSQDGKVIAPSTVGGATSEFTIGREKVTCNKASVAYKGPKVSKEPRLQSVERETSHSKLKGSILKQGVNLQKDPFDTVTLTSEGINTVAEPWVAECETRTLLCQGSGR